MRRQDIEQQLVISAFSMAVEPQRTHVLTGLLDDWFLRFSNQPKNKIRRDVDELGQVTKYQILD